MFNAARWCSIVVCGLSLVAMVPARGHAAYAYGGGSGVTGSPDTIRILALLVAFKTDADPSTTGDGRFLLTPDARPHIDPPPHDQGYVRSKIEFVHNYFRAASGGRLTVVGSVWDSVVTLPNVMSAYAPPTIGNDVSKLASLASDSWRIADSLYPAIDFSVFDAFVIFHAGVGRDIDQISLVGENLTPHDLPSLTFDSTGFARALGISSFAGFAVDSGRVHIRNTIILPETESRAVGSGGSVDTVELGINGLFASSIGSYLGLPDLFDTKTGRSGIGRYGMMDGASIFAFNGIFPPLPNAWERIALGWTAPIDIGVTAANIPMPAVGLGPGATDTVYRVAISPNEYFLLENRSRVTHGQGLTVRFVRSDGSRDSVYVSSDTTGFFLYDVSLIKGSVVDVSNFDWALPGSVDASHQYDGGGILIWHIDETVIQSGRASNAVNADPEHRGVALVEADGSKDIGQAYGFLEPGSGTEYGSPLDCWFAGNVTPTYRNAFDAASTPNSNSYSRARSLISISDFSGRAPRMTFSVQVGDATMTPLPGYPRSLPGLIDGPIPFDIDGTGATDFVFVRSRPGDKAEVVVWKEDGSKYLPLGDSSGRAARMDSAVAAPEIAFVRSAARGVSYCATVSDGVYLWSLNDANSDGLLDLVAKYPQMRVGEVNVLFVDTMLVAATKDSVSVYALSGQTLHSFRGTYWSPPSRPARVGATSVVAFASGDTLSRIDVSSGVVLGRRSLGHQVTGLSSGVVLPGDSVQILAQHPQGFQILSSNGALLSETNRTGSGSSMGSVPVLVDLDNDGAKEILNVDTSGTITALRWNGVIAEGFPYRLRASASSGTRGVVSLDADASGLPHLLFADDAGTIDWWKNLGGRGSLSSIAGLSGGASRLALFRHGTGLGSTVGLATTDAHGTVRAYDLTVPFVSARLAWPMYGFDPARSGSTDRTTANPILPSSQLLPRDRTYNWPNPVYGSSTAFRFFVSSDATVTVRIIDMAGHLVTTLRSHATGGTDNEIPWNVSGMQSGIYFAIVEAAAAGRTEQQTVRVAVVR